MVDTNSIGMQLALVPAGEFMMGSLATEDGRRSDEQQHRVGITKPFYLGVHEVTQVQYQQVMGTNPSHFKDGQHPVDSVSWDDAVAFCEKLSALPGEKLLGCVYRLPTEAEWEYACRAGTSTRFFFGDDPAGLADYAWFGENATETTCPVGQKRPNAWRLCDMHGNVWEWCADWYSDLYDRDPLDDPPGPIRGFYRVLRGGCRSYPASDCRSAQRYAYQPYFRSINLGFRVAAIPSASQAGGAARTADTSPQQQAIPQEQATVEQPGSPPQQVALEQQAAAAKMNVSVVDTNSIGMQLAFVPAGEFMMGSPPTEDGRKSDEEQHRVRITKPFYLGALEVTQAQYQQVMGTNPSSFKGTKHPVDSVSWDDAVAFCDKLSALAEEKAAGRTYRLPTEAEWEYACRAGTTTRFSFGDDPAGLADFAWIAKNASGASCPVGQKRPNAWGLCDMHGNVQEWCADWYGRSFYYRASPVDNPTGPDAGSSRVCRGGSWGNAASNCRSAIRLWSQPAEVYDYLGFRVVMVPSAKPESPASKVEGDLR